MNKVRSLVDSILVPHTAFNEAQRRMGQCIAYCESGAHEPACLALVGESRTGKSRCIEVLMRKHPASRLSDGMKVPIVAIVVPSRPTVKALAELILRALGAPDWQKGTENEKTSRCVKLMDQCGTLALNLDEFHHFYDKSSHKVQHAVADWLKNVASETKVALLVSGLPSLQAVVDQNEQLAGRFASPIRMPRFNWLDDDHRAEWLSILDAFTEGLRREFKLPALDEDELALRMYCATGGLMGYLTKTLRQAVWNAVDAGTKVIKVKDLETAYMEAVWSREQVEGVPNPFDLKRLIAPTQELVTQALTVGTPIVQAAPKRKVRPAAPPRLASGVLAA